MKLPVAEAAFTGRSNVAVCLWATEALTLSLLVKHFLRTYCVPRTVPGIHQRSGQVPALILFTVKAGIKPVAANIGQCGRY